LTRTTRVQSIQWRNVHHAHHAQPCAFTPPGSSGLPGTWNVGSATGTIDNLESFLESFGWESFTFEGWALLRSSAILGLFLIVLGTGIWVLAAVVFNLITELVGGVRVTVLEEEVVVRPVEQGPSQR
jgi:hypothetical protein